MTHISDISDVTTEELEHLQRDICPDCGRLGLRGGPRGGAGQNIFCDNCGAGFNVAFPRHIIMAQRIKHPDQRGDHAQSH